LNQVAQDVLPSQLGEVYETLTKVLRNIYQNPTEPKFRTLKKENKMMKEKVCKSQAAISLLLAVGFEDDGLTFHCPEGVDLGPMGEAIELLQCMAVSCQEDIPATTAAQDPAPAKVAETPSNGTTAMSGDTVEKVAKAPAVDPDAAAKKQPIKSAFDFENRAQRVERQQNAEGSLAELRQQQRNKFQDFKTDPNAKNQEAYQRPPSVANGGNTQQSWGDWMGGMFGGGSSGSSSGSRGGRQQPPNERRGPNIKGIGDLPKPIRRG